MKTLTWNVGGVRTSLARLLVTLHDHPVDLLILIEPKQRDIKLQYYRLKLGFRHALITCGSNIWTFWQASSLQFINIEHGHQASLLHFLWLPMQQKFSWTVVYGKHTILDRKPLWETLELHSPRVTDPWIIDGDFNTFLRLDEHRGRTSPTLRSLVDFNECVHNCRLQEVLTMVSPFTWARGSGSNQVLRRLDRMLCSSNFADYLQI